MQLTKENKLFLCSSVLAPRVQRANRATRKKLNIETDKVKSMTTPVKASWESRRIEGNLAGKSQVKLRLETVNVGSMVGRSAEVTETIGRRNGDEVALQEVRYKNEGVRKLRGGDFEYKLYRKGEETGRGDVGLMVKHDLVESVMEVRRVFPRIISTDIVVNEKVVTVISVNVPQSGRSEEEKEKFYEDLTAEVQSRHGICFVLGGFNGHVGRPSLGYDGIYGGFGWGERNRDGERILEFADSLDMVVGNTFFKKDDEKLITYTSGNCATVIDYAVVQKEVMKKVKDIKVIPGEECFSQHRLLITNLMMEHRAVKKLKNPGKVKLWRLKDEKMKRMMKDEMKDAKEEPESWEDWCKYIINVAKRVCGISKGGHNQKTTWWWNEEVKEVIKEKRCLYKVWQKKKDQRSKEQYWAMKKKVKRVVAAAKEKAKK